MTGRRRARGIARGAARGVLATILAAGVASTTLAAEPPWAPGDEGELVGRVAWLPRTPGPHWFWVSDSLLHRASLFDADRAEMLGTITAGTPGSGFIVLPNTPADRRAIYVPETYFSRGVRGERTDVVTAYDPETLEPKQEFPIPAKRAEYFPGIHSSTLTDDGRFLVVFDVAPAQSVTVVDTTTGQVTADQTTPACSLVYPSGPRRFFMLCADGEALVLTLDESGAIATEKRSGTFFDPEGDPMSEKGARVGNEWLFSSFDGIVHSIDASGDQPRFGETWSLLTDAERKEGWRPGGSQHTAAHAGLGRLYVVMHRGRGKDTHKEAGTEVWVYDLATRKRLQRIPVKNPLVAFVRSQAKLGDGAFARGAWWALEKLLPNPGANGLMVTQDPDPVLLVLSLIPPAISVHDAKTGAFLRDVSEPGLALGLLAPP
ncbi:MAG: amine dehydrogenase large subunit [Alphaproteobacteria bacterium]